MVATDAPLLPHQLERIARRAALGLARTGSVAGNGSGDLFLAFSTANPRAGDGEGTVPLTMLPNDRMDPLFEATVGATEEAIVNALVAARTMTGFRGRTVIGAPPRPPARDPADATTVCNKKGPGEFPGPTSFSLGAVGPTHHCGAPFFF